MGQPIGNSLERLCSQSEFELILVAPFVKHEIVQRLLNLVDRSVSITCITRWKAEEIRIGVSDIEVWDQLKGRQNTKLLLRQNLHAKYYRGDAKCLIGSANLTATALGWNRRPNIELLLPMDAETDSLASFESELIAGSTTVNDSIADYMRSVVAQLPERVETGADDLQFEYDFESRAPFGPESNISKWLPTLRDPVNLFTVYSGKTNNLLQITKESAFLDLADLRPPPWFDELEFNLIIGSILVQMPLIAALDIFCEKPQRFGAVTQFLRERIPDHNGVMDFDVIWQTFMRWLLYFLPGRYKRTQPRHSELFQRIDANLANPTSI